MRHDVIIQKEGSGIRLLIDDKFNQKTVSVLLSVAGAGKLSSMLVKAIESEGFTGCIGTDAEKTTSKEEIQKTLR